MILSPTAVLFAAVGLVALSTFDYLCTLFHSAGVELQQQVYSTVGNIFVVFVVENKTRIFYPRTFCHAHTPKPWPRPLIITYTFVVATSKKQ